MQASLARWAVVTFCTLGTVGCQSTKPGWWPGQKPLAYSQSSTTPPNVQQPQQYAQQQQQATGYTDPNSYNQAAGATAQGYPTGGYPIGSNAPAHDPYGAAAQQTAAGANAYSQGYGQTQQAAGGAYPEQYHNATNPYAQQGAGLGGYPDAQGATGYPSAQGYQQGGANPYGAAQGGYSGVRTADARTTAAPGYNTGSPYDTTNYGAGAAQDPNQYNQPGVSGQPTGAPTDQQYQSAGSWQPGNTGYNPPNTTPYQMPNGQYPSDPSGAGQGDTPYRPGSTKDFGPTGATTPTTGGYTSPTTGAAGAGYAAQGAYPGTAPAAAVDRYGRPIQDSAMGYDATMQR